MQPTRRHILEILKERKEATIDEIVQSLTQRIGKITAVTVRHHLEILRGDGLVAAPTVRRRSAPGRPQYVYSLTERAADYFPNNYQGLAAGLLAEMKKQLPHETVTRILQGVADEMVRRAALPDGPPEVRLQYVLDFLQRSGYTASMQRNGHGALLTIVNCPYEQVASQAPELCTMDQRLLENMLGVRTRRLSCQTCGDDVCRYLIPEAEEE